jgi:hypothetical protein
MTGVNPGPLTRVRILELADRNCEELNHSLAQLSITNTFAFEIFPELEVSAIAWLPVRSALMSALT